MKQVLSFILIFLLGMPVSKSQVILAQWSFPTGSQSDSLADGGIPANLNKAIHTEGGTGAMDFSKNGYTTKAAQATGWDNGAGVKCWVVEVTTMDYKDLKINSRHQSGGNNPGPRDWKVQYRIAAGGTWTDVPDAVLNVQNDWTTGVLDSVELPDECKNQSSLFIRWIMSSDINSAGGQVAASGINKIDDIAITGKGINPAIREENGTLRLTVYPNPATAQVRITSAESLDNLIITDATGRIVGAYHPGCREVVLETSHLPAGCYIIRATATTSGIGTARLLCVDE